MISQKMSRLRLNDRDILLPPSNNDALILPDYPMPSQMNLFGATPNNPSWEITRINREARNQADIASAISKAHFISQNNRPKSTKIAYNSKQKAMEGMVYRARI